MIENITITLPPLPRGVHLVTRQVLEQLPALPSSGLLHLFLKHTSAGITLNENADPTVRTDLNQYLNRLVPENQAYFRHTTEGSDDMPAHIKSSLIGFTITIPIVKGQLALGTWQGIYLCEFRDYGGSRALVATIIS